MKLITRKLTGINYSVAVFLPKYWLMQQGYEAQEHISMFIDEKGNLVLLAKEEQKC